MEGVQENNRKLTDDRTKVHGNSRQTVIHLTTMQKSRIVLIQE
jgi:hypothetical protein